MTRPLTIVCWRAGAPAADQQLLQVPGSVEHSMSLLLNAGGLGLDLGSQWSSQGQLLAQLTAASPPFVSDSQEAGTFLPQVPTLLSGSAPGQAALLPKYGRAPSL